MKPFGLPTIDRLDRLAEKGRRILHSWYRPILVSVSTALAALACSIDDPDAGSGGAGASGAAGQTGGMASAGQTGGGNTSAGSTNLAGSNAGGTASAAGTAGSTTLAGSPNGGAGGASGGASNAGAANGGASAGSGGAVSGCTGVTSKFCDDFEAQTTGMPPKGDFSVQAKAGAMLVDTSKAYSGTKALHITSPKPGATSFLNFTKQFPMNDFHGRAMFYLTSIPKADIHWDLIDSTSQAGTHWEIGGMYGKFILVVDPPDHGLTSNTFPTGKWFCLQWEFKYGGQGVDNSFLAKMDGTALDKGQFTGADSEGKKWDAAPWKNLSIGWTGYGSSDIDLEEWIDDLAIGDQPIACPAAK